MSQITVMTPAASDAEMLAALWAETFRQAYVATHRQSDLDAYCARHYTPDMAREAVLNSTLTCRVAMRGKTPLGYYTLRAEPCPHQIAAPSTELKQIYVLASEYGSGLGRVLLGDALNTARRSGHEHVWLTVSNKNLRAQEFYRKLGFILRGAGQVIEVGEDRLESSILSLRL